MQTKKIEQIILSFLVICLFFMCYLYAWVLKCNGDNIEHIHTSWLIWQDKIPYKDFFQHHNPLIWYVFAPLTAFLIDNIKIFQIFNTISFASFLVMALFQLKILKLSGLSKISSLTYFLIVSTSVSVLGSIDYRPDTFMFMFFFLATFYLLKYLKNTSLPDIVLSFLLYFLSFLCSQKIILNLLVVGGVVIYYLYTKKIKKSDFLQAIILPIMLSVLFLSYLYVNDALSIYIKSNYFFNLYIPSVFEENRILFPPFEYFDFYVFVPIGFVASIIFLSKGTYIEKFLSILFLEELALRVFYFSAFLHYNLLLILLAIMLSVMFLSKLKKISKTVFVVSVIYILAVFFYNYKTLYLKEIKNKDLITNYEYTFFNTTPCDYVINGYYSVYNLKAKDPAYYSILLGQIDVLGEKLNIAPRPNLNNIILEYKPKIISAGIYWDTYQEDRGKKIPAHIIDRDILYTYYDYTNIGSLYILKPKYHKQNCQYNGRIWAYED